MLSVELFRLCSEWGYEVRIRKERINGENCLRIEFRKELSVTVGVMSALGNQVVITATEMFQALDPDNLLRIKLEVMHKQIQAKMRELNVSGE